MWPSTTNTLSFVVETPLVVGPVVLLALSMGASEPLLRERDFSIPNASADTAILMTNEANEVVATGGINSKTI